MSRLVVLFYLPTTKYLAYIESGMITTTTQLLSESSANSLDVRELLAPALMRLLACRFNIQHDE